MAVTPVTPPTLRSPFVRWPAAGFDPGAVWADYDSAADELLVYFRHPVGSTSVPIHTPDRDYLYLLVDDETDTVVGLHVDDLAAGVGAAHPGWAPLADENASAGERRAAVAALVADAAGMLARYGAAVGRDPDPTVRR